MYNNPHGSTPKQWAYARNKVAGNGKTKKEVAQLSGYSPATAGNIGQKIEKSKGYKNALAELSIQSNSLLLKILGEFERRDLEDFSNKDLMTAINTMTHAWSKIDIQTQERMNKDKDPDKNPLRSLFMKRSNVLVVSDQTPKEAKVVPNNEEKEKNIHDIEQMDL